MGAILQRIAALSAMRSLTPSAVNGRSEPKAAVFGALSLLRLMAVNEGFARFQKRLNHTIIANPVTGSPFDRKRKLEADLE